jgi:hypothetical protein
VTPPSQARPHETAIAPGAHVTDPDEVQALLVDIFARTGQKVEPNDPLVAAALIHSTLLRRAGEDAALAIAQAAQNARHDLACSLQQQRQTASHLHQAGQLSPGRATALALLCLLASALGASIALGAHRWLG